MENSSKITFQQVLEALLNIEQPLSPRYLYRLSDLETRELKQLGSIWDNIPPWRRKALIEDIEELGQGDTLLSFDALGKFALKDVDPEVRLPAVRILWEYEDPALVPVFIQMAVKDTSMEVRAAAAGALGIYVYLGELEELDQKLQNEVEEHLVEIVNGKDDPLVRQNALESLGFSSQDIVDDLILKAFESGELKWVQSALFAMGRSTNERWKPQVQSMLANKHPQLRAEAARAAGELDLVSSVPLLIELLDDPDDQTRLASIWSLSQLGGERVPEILEQLALEAEDNDEREFIESAIENLTFNQEMHLLPFIDVSEVPISELDESDNQRFDLFDDLDEELYNYFDGEYDELDIDEEREWRMDELDEDDEDFED